MARPKVKKVYQIPVKVDDKLLAKRKSQAMIACDFLKMGYSLVEVARKMSACDFEGRKWTKQEVLDYIEDFL